MNGILNWRPSHSHKKLTLFLLALFGLGLGAHQVQAQNYYVFYNSNYGYITINSGSPVASASFSPSAVWEASGVMGETSRSLQSYSVNSNYLYSNDNKSVIISNSTNAKWRINSDNQLYFFAGKKNYYVYGQTLQLIKDNTSAPYVAYPVTITNHTGSSITPPSITVAINSTTDGLAFTHTNISGNYTPEYTTYTINHNVHNYYGGSDHGTNTPESVNLGTGTTYTWSITAGSDYATIDQNGILRTKGNATTQHNVTVTLTTSNTTAGYNNTQTYTVSIQDFASQTPPATITGATSIENLNGIATLSCSISGNYSPAYTNYRYSSTNHYLCNGHSYSSTSDIPTILPGDSGYGNATWTISGEGAAYSSIGASTGVLTYTTGSDHDVIVNVNATISHTSPNYNVVASAYSVTLLSTLVAAPTFTREEGSNGVYIHAQNGTTTYYTLDGSDPTDSSNPNRMVYDPENAILLESASTTIKAYSTRGSNASTVTEETFIFQLYKPEITISNEGLVTIVNPTTNNIATGSVIYYTTDGSTPTTSSSVYTGTFTVDVNTTVKAIVALEDFLTSPVASAIYSKNSGIYGSSVMLYDLEDHNWNYYKGEETTVGNTSVAYKDKYRYTIYSPDPRNVIITYNGVDLTGNLGSNVAVSPTEPENQFIFNKTVEKYMIGFFTDDNGNGLPDEAVNVNEQYAYTVISNPFSKRPSQTNGGDKTYYGFAGWKIVSGAQYIGRGANRTQASNGDVLDLDEIIHFINLDDSYTPNCISAEVVLETTWTEATVWSGNTAHTFEGGTYETNFIVASANIASITQNSPCTIIGMNPDGTDNNSTSRTITGLTVGTNTVKVEWIRHGGDSFNANGHNMILGRGITSSSGAAQGSVYGINTANTDCVNIVKVESGYYSKITNLGNNGARATNEINCFMIMGCDYDRALADYYVNASEVNNNPYNIKLRASRIYGTNGASPQLNRGLGQLYIRSLIKSGVFSNSLTDEYYFHAYTKAGQRFIEMEGGYIKGNIKGGSENTYNQEGKRSMSIRVRNGRVDSQIGCGSTYNHCSGDRVIAITGGRFGGWIAPGSNCMSDGGDGLTDGESYVYFGGTAEINSRQFGSSGNDMMGHSTGGAIYGAGLGFRSDGTSGRMRDGSNIVFADNAYCERGIYGGGAMGATLDTANIYILGGRIGTGVGTILDEALPSGSQNVTIQAGVYGGACKVGGENSYIYMSGGIVESGIYGGSNYDGTMTGSTRLNIIGGQVGTSSSHANIHGGGYGQPTQVSQNVNINIGERNTTGPTIYGDIYGGSALGRTNSEAANNTFSTSVTFNAGTLTGDLYGGALGNSSIAANVNGPVTVNINGGTINGRVFGCNNINGAPQRTVNVNMTGGTISQSLYGGGNAAAYAHSSGPVINMTGGKITRNLFGAGLGNDATVSGNTNISISGSSNIGNNVFGGGENGDVNLNTTIAMSGGKVINNVFGAGYGNTSLVVGNTNVTINGTANVGNNVYGGGENGDVTGTTTVTIAGQETKVSVNNVYGAGYGSTSNIHGITNIHIDGGKVKGSVFGGGEMGHADDDAIVTMTGGRVAGDVHGGAQGISGQGVLVDGLKTVNMLGGVVETNVYGGSRSVDDDHPSDNLFSSFVNISGGTVDRNVYGGGFYGGIEGSVAILIGKNVIDNHDTISPYNIHKGTHTIAPLTITGNIYAGSNWGTFTGGDFGASNIKGRSDIFVDGTGYDMTFDNGYSGNYMVLNKSIYGAGTSTDAGSQGRKIVVRNYGLPIMETMTHGTGEDAETESVIKSSTRSLRSIQRCDELVICNSHIDFKGQGNMTSNITTEIYSIINVFDVCHIANSSSIIFDFPIDNIKKFESDTLVETSIYSEHPNYTVVNTDDEGHFAIAGSTSKVPDNKLRINNGTFLNVRYLNDTDHKYYYGELSGFFHIASPKDNTMSFAYARLKLTDKAKGRAELNTGDGGFLSYFESDNDFEDNGDVWTAGLQHPYTNQLNSSKDDTEEFRYWRFKVLEDELISNREAVFIAQTNDSESKYITSDCVIPLPAACDEDSYFIISALDWGVDVFASDTAAVNTDASEFMDWHEVTGDQPGAFTYGITSLAHNQIRDIDHVPDLAFGLVAIPSGGLEGTHNQALLLSDNSLELVQQQQIVIENIEERPELRLRLTYSNSLTLNNSLSPFFITIDQYCKVGDTYELHDRTNTEITVTTATHIPQNLETNIYDLAFGTETNPYDYTRTITLPIFNLTDGEIQNVFKVTNITMDAGALSILKPYGTPTSEISSLNMLFGAADNRDDQNGWLEPNHTLIDVVGADLPYTLGTADGRSMFSLDFQLFFDGSFKYLGPNNQKIGTVTFTIKQYHEDGIDEISTFTIKLNIVVRNARIDWYLDGINGENRYNGHWPDAAKRTLGGIYNADYVPGDNIWAVNMTDIRYTSEWSSRAFNSVTIKRYPGGVDLFRYNEAHETEYYYEDYLEEYNPDNELYAGPILYLDGGVFTIKGIILDGSDDLNAGSGASNAPSGPEPGDKARVETVKAIWPLVYLQRKEGDHVGEGTFVMTNSSILQNNTNIGMPGGGVYVSDGTECVVMGGSQIIDNVVSGEISGIKTANEGGGVYVECGGKLTVAQKVTITDNEAHEVENNVFLEGGCDEDLTINVGYEVDEVLTGLEEGSQIGITKAIPDGEYYTPVVYSTRPSYIENADEYFFDDEELYGVLYLPEEPFETYQAYFVDTWVTNVRTEPEGWSLNNIDSAEDLAWLISYVNGYNGSTAHPNASATLTADVDMGAHVWVPIGASSEIPFTGHFDGQAHTIDSLLAPFKITDNLGLFGYVDGADIKGVFVTSCDFAASPDYMGVVVGELHNSDLYYSEGAGNLKGGSTTIAMGGLVGLVDNSDVHSSMAMATMEGDCHLGGLVGELSSGSTLKNVFSNGVYKFTGSTNKYIGGLVGDNKGTVDNGYVRSLRTGSNTAATTLFKSFSGNNASVTHCYDANDYTATSTPYMYKHKDNMIGTHSMTDTLNKFVSGILAPWMRSSAGSINDDYPILKLPYNAMGSEDNIILKYGTLATMITRGNAAEGGATLFQYRDEDIEGATTDSDVTIYIQEDASLLHTSNNISAYVGITVGNNSTNPVYGHDGVQQSADWHIISSSLKDAPLGVNYGDDNTQYAYWDDPENSELPHFPFYEESEKDGYFPSKEFGKEYDDKEYPYTYDFYHFYEPQYHWINFKRNSASHYHEDGPHLSIAYTNEETLIPGRGYLISIDTTTFMQSHGHLNCGTINTQVTTSGTYLTGCNMIGNPYQSYLNFNAFANQNSSLWGGETPSYILFDAVEGGYVQYTVDSKGIGVSKGAKAGGQYLHPHQGFYIIALTAGNATFTNDMRAFNPGDAEFRGEEQPEYPLINVVASDTLNHKEFAVVEFGRPVLDGCDKNDYIYEGNYHTYFHHGSEDYGILFLDEPTDHVALFFEAMEENDYTLTFSTANAEYTYLHLIDNLTGNNVDLLVNDTYTFHAKPSDYKARFKIVFSYKFAGIEEDNEGYDDFMFFNGSEWVVEGEGNLRVVDVTGRVIYTEELHSSHNVINMPRVAAGVYMVELRNNATRSTQKIVIR